MLRSPPRPKPSSPIPSPLCSSLTRLHRLLIPPSTRLDLPSSVPAACFAPSVVAALTRWHCCTVDLVEVVALLVLLRQVAATTSVSYCSVPVLPPSSLNMDIALSNQLAAAHDETRSISPAALLPTAPLQDLCGPGSPGSSSSTTNQLRTLAQKNPRVIRIPLRILLNIMLEQLGVSKAEYHLHMCEGSKVRVTVLFNTSTLPVEGAPVYLSMSGIESESYEIAEDSASIQAITYVEEATNTIIKDLSYGRLIEVKGQNKILLHKLKKAHEYKKQLARGWFLSVRHMSSFSRQVLNITYLNYYAVQDSGDTLWKNLLTNFQDLGFRLKHAGNVLEKRLEKMRKDNFS